ncbi:hypothetical protein SteCoe_27143 [Stentor coeruleus]|uniref:TLC domain-containing protein n=1 Tax=Stentor coeruleus TaxID=5963 RepID=A0A1R2BB99_9CILI|nr:hypothetical protein SteCoe_27143 [Stentor coeruleus]
MIIIPIAFIFYFALYLLLSGISPGSKHLVIQKRRKLNGFFVALTHSSLCLLLSFFSYVSLSGVSYTRETTDIERLIINNTLGYLIYDLVITGFLFRELEQRMVLHHICGIVGGIALFFDKNAGSAVILAILLTENTSPFYQMKHVLKILGKSETKFAKVNDAVFALLFVTIRPWISWFLAYNMLASELNFIVKINTILMYSVGVAWSYSIICMIKNRLWSKEKGMLEKIGEYKFLSGCVLAFIAIGLPYIVREHYQAGFLHIRYRGFTFI